MALTEGEEIVMSIVANIPLLMGLAGLLMVVVTPLYFMKVWRKRGNIVKPIICFSFGIAFITAWLYGGSL